jgi:hypothetical protein
MVYLIFFVDPNIKTRVRLLLSPIDIVSDDHQKLEQGLHELSYSKSSTVLPEPLTSPSQQYQHQANYCLHSRNNGTCSDASSDFESLIPQQLDNFKEEQRMQWEPLATDKFTKQKNPPRYACYITIAFIFPFLLNPC